MIAFHVTKEIFEMYKNKVKTHEYRIGNDYWMKRLNKLSVNSNNIARIYNGYTSEYIEMYFVTYNFIHERYLPEYSKKYFEGNNDYYMIIDFELKFIN